ncbi:DUF3606 domain-containing protein [Mesorhizobium sp. B2-1-3A]|uniref:DUF3606 domain-containing protein n=1 Tax=Mesorhizobium sp. B2-1-3A TaxID=2589971 RepID=UPI0011265D55|nr:DUF3606 domain-containing protein [Mesorhizobium sp. B2-1-3A]TPM90166.1 DUF3606 domain-containing protein [Mesorhizobium sp. B2-1-3A]
MRENGKILLQLFHACKRRSWPDSSDRLSRPPDIPFCLKLATREPIARCSRLGAVKMQDDTGKDELLGRRSKLSEDEVEEFARQAGVTAEQVRELIKATGRDRAALLAAAEQLRALSDGGPLTQD